MNHKPAVTGTRCPCQGCSYNATGSGVDYHDHDTEIGCTSRRMCKGGRIIVPIKPMDITKAGCQYRS